MTRRPVAHTAIHDLGHLAGLSSQVTLILRVSERTMYLLQNFAALDVNNPGSYAVELNPQAYIPVRESDPEYELFQDVRDAAQLEILEGDEIVPETELTHVIAWCQSGSMPHQERANLVYGNEVRDTRDEYDHTTGIFVPDYAGVYQVGASLLLADSTAWNAHGEYLALELWQGETAIECIIDRRFFNLGGVNTGANVTGRRTVELAADTAYRVRAMQISGSTQTVYPHAPYAEWWSRLEITRVLDYEHTHIYLP